MMGKDLKDLKLIVCHLGSGASITAVKDANHMILQWALVHLLVLLWLRVQVILIHLLSNT